MGREDIESDFGQWLTRDLRPKGAVPEPSSTERVKVTESVAVSEPEAEFSRWLLADLRPRNSSLPPVDALGGVALLAPVDSLAPQTVNDALGIPSQPLDVALDAQDLAVLPPRRRAGKHFGRSAAILLLLLGSIGLVARFGFGPGRSQASVPAVAESPVAAAPLPPSAPEVVEVVDEPAPLAPVATPSRHTSTLSTPAPTPAVPESLMPRGRRSGSSIARFADLPSPTLSRLAKDEQKDTHEHDATVRAAAKRSPAHSAAVSSPSP